MLIFMLTITFSIFRQKTIHSLTCIFLMRIYKNDITLFNKNKQKSMNIARNQKRKTNK